MEADPTWSVGSYPICPACNAQAGVLNVRRDLIDPGQYAGMDLPTLMANLVATNIARLDAAQIASVALHDGGLSPGGLRELCLAYDEALYPRRDGLRDWRYTVTHEPSSTSRPYVGRFCGEYVTWGNTEETAWSCLRIHAASNTIPAER
jgi:hypothetical protein